MKFQPLLDATRLIFDLQQVNEVAQSISGNLNSTEIAHAVTEALIDRFDCVFARVWLVEASQKELRLVASSGLYTHIDGSFARVPMGAYKVGKIAQNRVPFLSNQLPEEPWVKDRDWAIANQIQGFAGYPLMVGERVLGVLAAFSRNPFAPEFLEVLQVLCMTLTIGVDAALQQRAFGQGESLTLALSDQLASILQGTRLMLVGTEQPLGSVREHAFLQAASILSHQNCSYCRLTYHARTVSLEAIMPQASAPDCSGLESQLSDLRFLSHCLRGSLQVQTAMQGNVCQFFLELPCLTSSAKALRVRVRCRQSLMQRAIVHLAYEAGLMVCGYEEIDALLLTDQTTAIDSAPVIWIRSSAVVTPEDLPCIDLSTTPEELREWVEQAFRGELALGSAPQALSSREQQVMQLLAEGLRDRDIAQKLFISESTVKFHINNSLTKLNAKNRYQGVYQAVLQGWV